ncbi:hypothetical protein HN832_02515 [archaeon]|jgi:hypothetical protein|nr:hypothetical protein [archaeon]MBT4373227.1 hypothetical protein [archaeon]MBT4531572.1 hypothetical protein [archaeon]MBT7001250.1 hypothetical protein [archaeon]MBT7282264.1 hypothetical protein [archaeon]
MAHIKDARTPKHLVCYIIEREPYKIQTTYGSLNLPEDLVPSELRENQDKDNFRAKVTADLKAKEITSLIFESF